MKGLSTDEYRDLILSVGTHRSERVLSPLEVAQLLNKAVTAGTLHKECAEALQVGTTQISTFLKLVRLAPDIQHLSDWRGTTGASIAFSTLAELAPLKPADQIKAAEAILRHRLTWKEVVQLVQIAKRSRKSVHDCIADILKLRPQVETRYLFAGAIINNEAKQYLTTLTQQERDELMDQTMNKILPFNYPATSRLGPNNFTIISNHDLAKLLDVEPDQLETDINAAIDVRGSYA